VTIKPIHSLVAFLMQGVAQPSLLIQGGQSPHNFSLRPSDMRRLHQADLIVWVGPDVESALSNLLSDSQLAGRVVRLTGLPDMQWLSPRQHEEWEARKHKRQHSEHEHSHDAEIDNHIWLSPLIASQIAQQLTEQLSEIDPAHAGQYRHNSQRLLQRLQQLDSELAAQLRPLKGVPYIVFHDAYHYFEQHYDLNAVGSVSVSPERQPGAHHIHDLRSKINRLQARCVFSEPQFRPKLVQTLVEDTQAGSGQLDPLGTGLEPGPEAYFQLMQQLADNLLQCLLRD
jgi:zinc transport system substrate-binding protein